MERLEDCISFLAAKAAQRITRRARERLAPHDVTPTQYAVLRVLWEEDGRSGAESCARLGLDSATVTGLVDRLGTAGLAERRGGGADRRVHRVVLTDRGRGLREPLDAAIDALNAEVAAELGPDAPALWATLRRLGGVRA